MKIFIPDKNFGSSEAAREQRNNSPPAAIAPSEMTAWEE